MRALRPSSLKGAFIYPIVAGGTARAAVSRGPEPRASATGTERYGEDESSSRPDCTSRSLTLAVLGLSRLRRNIWRRDHNETHAASAPARSGYLKRKPAVSAATGRTRWLARMTRAISP